MIKPSLLLILFHLLLLCSYAQQSDSASVSINKDSILREIRTQDSLAFIKYSGLINHSSPLLDTSKKSIVADVQQKIPGRTNALIFVVLILSLLSVTYVKISFGNELTDVVQSFVNRSIAQQIQRTHIRDLSIASLLLHINFIFTFSIFIRYALVQYFNVTSLNSFSEILFLNFLFTFFYVAKLTAMMMLGKVFELESECNEYVFNFTTTCKTLGLVLIPALFIFYTSEKIIFDFVFITSIIICIIFLLLFLWRGLSTSTKLLYRSVYHFFVYVWVIEILPIFLLFKLLTKTVT